MERCENEKAKMSSHGRNLSIFNQHGPVRLLESLHWVGSYMYRLYRQTVNIYFDC